MSNSAYGAVPSGHVGILANFSNADGTVAKVLLEAWAALAPVEAPGVPVALSYGGPSLIDLCGTSDDTADRTAQLYLAEVLTTVGTATGTAATTASTATRATGSFITDGWKPGERVMIFAPPTDQRQAGVEGVLALLTTVTATTLTFSGTPFGAATLNSATRICRVAPLFADIIPAGSGTLAGLPEKWIQSNVNPQANRVLERKLGANQMLVAAMQVAVTATKNVALVGQAARY